jgi:hypothetical protein
MSLFVEMMARHGSRITRALQRRHRDDDEALIRCYRAALGIAADQATRAHHDVDHVTILECRVGCRATKSVTPDGVGDYACGRWFATTEAAVSGIGELADLLGQIERKPRWFIIRGKLIEGRHPGRVRRLLHPDKDDGPYFEPRPRRWAGLDFDSFELPAGVDPVDLDAVAAQAIARLPEPFCRASCWAQLTSGAGIKPGGRIRLFYWLDRPAAGADLKRWLKDVPGLDGSTLNDVMPNYVARPIFVGVADPVPVRSRLIAGEVDAVAVPAFPAPKRREAPPAEAIARPYVAPGRGLGFRPTRPEQYMLACLRGIVAALSGQGRERCVKVALTLYGLAKAGLLDPADVTERIKGIMRDRGWADDEQTRGNTLTDINRALGWAWDHAQPRTLP